MWQQILSAPAPVQAALIAGSMSVLGVVLGILLVRVWDYLERRRRKQAIRTMLRTEINHNIAQLARWNNHRRGAFPTQSQQIWQTQLPEVPGSLKTDEIPIVHDFYYRRHLLRNRAKQLEEQKREEEERGRILGPMVTEFLNVHEEQNPLIR